MSNGNSGDERGVVKRFSIRSFLKGTSRDGFEDAGGLRLGQR